MRLTGQEHSTGDPGKREAPGIREPLVLEQLVDYPFRRVAVVVRSEFRHERR